MIIDCFTAALTLAVHPELASAPIVATQMIAPQAPHA